VRIRLPFTYSQSTILTSFIACTFSGDNFGMCYDNLSCVAQLTFYCLGVQIQEGDKASLTFERSSTYFHIICWSEVLNELSRAQESAYGLRDTMRAQHGVRAKLCAKLIKYPNIEDYVVSMIAVIGSLSLVILRMAQIALRDHDEKQLFMTRQHLHDVRNVYAILFDILQKVRGVILRHYHLPMTRSLEL